LESRQRHVILRTERNEEIISRIFWLPDGKHIGYFVYDNTDHEIGTWSIDLQGQNNVRINQDSIEPLWNRSGTKFATEETNETSGGWYSAIYVTNISTNQKQQVFEATKPNTFPHGISWSYDDKILAFSYGDGGSEIPEERPKIFFIDLETSERVQFTSDRFEEYTYPQFSPVNDLIAFGRRQPSFFRYTTVIKDVSTNCQIELPITALAGAVSWSPDGKQILISNSKGDYIVNLSEFIGPKFKETGSICP
jgi:Tol biopolymer transport system component